MAAGRPGAGVAASVASAFPEEASRERALNIVQTNPKQAAGVVKEWMQES
jgi:flagellar biosynthesis/type III secretory pathway M-ring protein FliF/YscJ